MNFEDDIIQNSWRKSRYISATRVKKILLTDPTCTSQRRPLDDASPAHTLYSGSLIDARSRGLTARFIAKKVALWTRTPDYFCVCHCSYYRMYLLITSLSGYGLYHTPEVGATHDDVIKWKHNPRYWPFVRGIHRSPVNSPHKGQWRGALMFSLIYAWMKGWVNNREAGDLTSQ